MGIAIQIGGLTLGSSSGGAVDPCIPTNLVITPREGGSTITFTQTCPLQETEVWVSVDGAEATLVTTLAPAVETYDYDHDFGVTLEVSLRSKLDETVLNVPTDLAAAEITGGVRITWSDNNTEAEYIEIWGAVEGAATALIATVEDGVETYDHVGDILYCGYKIRAKEGTLPVYSEFTSVVNYSSAFYTIVNDGNHAFYDIAALSTITKDVDNFVTQWTDRLGTFLPLISTTVYRPTYNSTGMIFSGGTSSAPCMYTDDFAWAQPKFIYLVFKQITWTDGRRIWSARTGSPEYVYQFSAAKNISLYGGGTVSSNPDLELDTWGILRVKLQGATSKITTDGNAPVTGNGGIRAGGGMVLGAAYNLASASNIQVKALVCSKVDDGTGANEATIYNYLKSKYGL